MWIKTTGILLWIVILHTTAFARSITTVIGPPVEPPIAGHKIIFPVYYHNSKDHPVTLTLPRQLDCLLKAGQETFEAVAKRIDSVDAPTIAVGPQSYVMARFSLASAPEARGEVLLMVPEISANGLMLTIRPPSPARQEPGERFSWTQRSEDRPMDSLIELYQPYAKNISFYKPMYFLVGTEPEDSKFQISFKYRFFNPKQSLAQRYPWVQGFHFGYSQTSYWDLSSDSAPFEDTSYRPELFFISPRIKTSFFSLDGLFIKTGLQHESNGQGGELSRSTNTAYIEPISLFYNAKKKYGLKISTKVWLYFNNEDENNPDIEDYRGYFNLGITAGKADGLVVDTNFQWAAKGPSIQLDITHPLSTYLFSHFDFYLHLNYTNTLAERLVNYTEREQAVRIGLAIVR